MNEEIEPNEIHVPNHVAIPFIVLGVIVSMYCFSSLLGILLGLYDVVKILNIE
jgi:hypothetical protein